MSRRGAGRPLKASHGERPGHTGAGVALVGQRVTRHSAKGLTCLGGAIAHPGPSSLDKVGTAQAGQGHIHVFWVAQVGIAVSKRQPLGFNDPVPCDRDPSDKSP
jgi:hypothetical protein